ncbi:reverse transcriptase domain-containing protein [Tanacetum coccineum]
MLGYHEYLLGIRPKAWISIQCPEASASPLRSIPAEGSILKQPLMSQPAEDTSSDGLLTDGNLQLTHSMSCKAEAISPLMNVLRSTNVTVEANQDESFLFAMQLATASVLPMVVKTAIELDLLETIAKAGPGGLLSASEIVAQLPNVSNPEAPVVFDGVVSIPAWIFISNWELPAKVSRHDDAVIHGGLVGMSKLEIRSQKYCYVNNLLKCRKFSHVGFRRFPFPSSGYITVLSTKTLNSGHSSQTEDEREPRFIRGNIDTDFVPEHVFPAEEQPLPPVDSPTAESPGYIAESDPEEDPEYEDDEEQGGPLRLFPSPEGTKPIIPPPVLPHGARNLTSGFRHLTTSTQALIDAVTAALPSTLLPPLSIGRRDKIPESEMPPRKRSCLFAIGSRYEAGGSSTTRPTGGRGTDYGFVSTVDMEARRQGIRDVGYGIRDTWIDPAEAVPAIAPKTVEEVNTRVVELAELHEHDTQDLYALLEDAQDGRSRISQQVDKNSQRVDLLMGDRMTLQETVWTVEEEAYAARVAWNHSIGLSQETYQELQTHRDHVYAHETHLQTHQTQLQLQSTLIQTPHQVSETRFQMQQTAMAKLRETDRGRQAQLTEALRLVRDMRQEMGDMQTELLSQREQLPEERHPEPQEATGNSESHT